METIALAFLIIAVSIFAFWFIFFFLGEKKYGYRGRSILTPCFPANDHVSRMQN